MSPAAAPKLSFHPLWECLVNTLLFLHCNQLVYILFFLISFKLRSPEAIGSLCCADCSLRSSANTALPASVAREAWQRWGDEIPVITSDVPFSKAQFLFLTVIAKLWDQIKGHSPRNKALAEHKGCSTQSHGGQPAPGEGEAEARSDCLSPDNGTNFQCSYASWAPGRHQGIQLNGL